MEEMTLTLKSERRAIDHILQRVMEVMANEPTFEISLSRRQVR